MMPEAAMVSVFAIASFPARNLKHSKEILY
jgi:hypothetical protein